ncbi:hypothetical protein BJ875DRAFT_518177 [Amylocarpus encephaloides]|uniref:Uncharacterized protein n=1 Tax=Amylocarpus encephaloides TaxID=45428 RepID=A0A9P7YDK7_9HELO|nr:hypothetical protein BJ875DRAFT_518177 [Amylocarpus encephaloides]
MRFVISTLYALTAAVVTARISVISAPSTIAPGVPFTLTARTTNGLQTTYDVAIAFGLSPSPSHSHTLDTILNSFYLGPSKSNVVDNINFTVAIDAQTAKGVYVLGGASMGLYGVGNSPVLREWNVTVSVGKETGGEWMSSRG